MVLFSLLIVLLLEQLQQGPANWRFKPIASRWWRVLDRFDGDSRLLRSELGGPLLVIAPALILAALLWWLDSALITFVVNVLVLAVVMGCPQQREALRCYLKAANEDGSACEAYRGDLLDEDLRHIDATVGVALVWHNFRYYFAVAFWFILAGAPGVLAYGLLRECLPLAARHPLHGVMQWVDFLPARVAGFCYLLVGHFSRAFPVWLSGLFNIQTPTVKVLADVAQAAEDVQPTSEDFTEEPNVLLNLAKRTMLLLLAFVAFATLFGWVV